MNVRIINPLDIPNWDSMAGSLPGYMFFHSSAWCRVLSESYGYKPIYFTGWENDELLAVVPMMEVKSIFTGRRGVCLPFTDCCRPLLTDKSDFIPLLEAIKTYGRSNGWKFFELRDGHSFLLYEKTSTSYLGHRIDLAKGMEYLQKGQRESTRRNARKAASVGVSIEIGRSFNLMKEFYTLNCVTRQRHGLPPQPFQFFERVFKYVIDRSLGFLVIARYADNSIAGAVFFHAAANGGSVFFKYGASDERYNHLRPNNLVMREAINFFAQRGYEEMLLGRTDIEHTGLRQFKTGWGSEEYVINYYRYDLERDVFVNGRKTVGKNFLDTNAFRYTPLPLLKLAGKVMYRHFG